MQWLKNQHKAISQLPMNVFRRPWYRRTSAAPHQISISTPYMDAAGVGKINTISQAVFEGTFYHSL